MINFITGGREMGYPKYAWIGNQISDSDMSKLYQQKKYIIEWKKLK